jgi:3-oxoacyl-(acyl-carrier-protein) synthase/SAM-dependent methyltransferase/acyl carrier protein
MSDIDVTGEQLSPVKRALLEIRQLRAQLATVQRTTREPIAIVGAAVRLPGGVSDLTAFWNVLNADGDAIEPIPLERWDADAVFSADPDEAGKTYSRHGGFLTSVELFDAAFFGISPREAESMDPQHRLLLELTWEALENAAIAPASLSGSKAGVFIGLSNSEYGRLLMGDRENIDAYTSFGAVGSIAAGRISYFLNAKGPSFVVDTACSSSLSAVHLACTSLAMGEADLAIAGGTNLLLTPDSTIALSKARMLAPDGQCKTFDDAADGYVRGEGGAVVVLKRLADARAAGDPVMAVIRSSAMNHDGRSAGLTAPNGPAQEAVIASALLSAGVESAAIDYVEAHGTGTSLGDPIELQALANVFARPPDRPLAIASIKRKLGHLEAAAGLAGLIKLALALDRERLPAHGTVDRPTSMFAWDTSGLEILESARDWRRGERSRIAGVSAFSFSGTNVHAVLEEAPAVVAAAPGPESSWLFTLSAKSESTLRDLVNRYVAWLPGSSSSIADICATVNAGRSHHRHRFAVRVSTKADVLRDLRAWLDGRAAANVLSGTAEEPAPAITFACPHRVEDAERVAHTLCRESAAFDQLWRALDLEPAVASCTPGQRATAASVALEIAAGRYLERCGVAASHVVATGDGALAAACLAGACTAAEAIGSAINAAGSDVRAAEEDQAEGSAPGACVISLGLTPAEPSLLTIVQRLYVAGATIAWEQVDRGPRRLPGLPTYPFERRAYWRPRAHAARPAGRSAPWPKIVAAAAQQSESGPLGWNVDAYAERWARFDELAATLVANTFVSFGAFCTPGETHTVDDLITAYAIKPLYRRLVQRWLSRLAQRGELRSEGETFVSDRALKHGDVSALWFEIERLLADDPDVLAYTRRASSKLADLLTGAVSPLDVLFERGALDSAEAIYQRSPSARYFNGLVAAAVRAALADHDPREPFRLLEAGAGTGGTTAALAPFFPSDGEYWFTDVSDVFLARAKRKFSDNAAFRFAKLDLDAPVLAALPTGACDVVLAANVVHATRDVGATLDQMRAFLKPGGMLILLETTAHHAMIDMTIAFIEGWSAFDDAYRSDHPLLDADRWQTLALERGYVEAARFPAAGSPADIVGQHVIIARNGDGARVSNVSNVKPHPSAAIPAVHVDVPVPQLDGLRDDERREQLRAYAAACVRYVLQLDAQTTLGSRERFSDLGMDSLMALQLKSLLESQLGVEGKLAATIAFDTGTVESLAEQLFVLASPHEPAVVAASRPAETISIEQLAQYSDAEVEAMLVQRLGTKPNAVGRHE